MQMPKSWCTQLSPQHSVPTTSVFAKDVVLTHSGFCLRMISVVLLRNYLRTTLGLEEGGGLGCLHSKIRKRLLRMQVLSGMKMSVDHGLTIGTLVEEGIFQSVKVKECLKFYCI